MKLKLNLLLILISALTLSNLNAQNELLDSLTKANMEDLDPSTEIMIDGISIPGEVCLKNYQTFVLRVLNKMQPLHIGHLQMKNTSC